MVCESPLSTTITVLSFNQSKVRVDCLSNFATTLIDTSHIGLTEYGFSNLTNTWQSLSHMLPQISLMKNKDSSGYLTIAIAAGLFTLTVAGLSIVYARSRKRMGEKEAIGRSSIEGDDEKFKAKYTTRHGSHLTKTTQGISDTEADIKQEAK
jgi:HJR/Mrr/RecB family endonuclease